MPKVIDAPKRARDTVRKKDLQSIQAALVAYSADNGGNFPPPAGACVSGISATISQYFQGSKVPSDPVAGRAAYGCMNGSYAYNIPNAGKCIVLAAQMEVSGSGNGNQAQPNIFDGNFCTTPDYQNLGNGPKNTFFIVQNF